MGGVEIQLHVGLFLISTLAADEWPASFPGRFTSEKKFPDTHRTQGRSGPQNGPGGHEERLYKNDNPAHFIVAPDVVSN